MSHLSPRCACGPPCGPERVCEPLAVDEPTQADRLCASVTAAGALAGRRSECNVDAWPISFLLIVCADPSRSSLV